MRKYFITRSTCVQITTKIGWSRSQRRDKFRVRCWWKSIRNCMGACSSSWSKFKTICHLFSVPFGLFYFLFNSKYWFFFRLFIFFFFIISFKLNFHPRVVGTTNNLKIIVSNETAGRYYCKASVIGFPEIKSEANVYVKQAPKIESPSKQYGAKGDTLRLECAAFSVPKARHISWSFNGIEINTMSDRDYSILEDPSSPRLIKSTLIIRDSQDWHFGKYNCTVVNDYGVDVLQIDLIYQCKKRIFIRNDGMVFVQQQKNN